LEPLSKLEHAVLLYLKAKLEKNELNGVNSKTISNDIDTPLNNVNAICEELDKLGYARIIERHMEGGKVKDLDIRVTEKGLDYMFKEKGIPL
jgi:hypothetical protein